MYPSIPIFSASLYVILVEIYHILMQHKNFYLLTLSYLVFIIFVPSHLLPKVASKLSGALTLL